MNILRLRRAVAPWTGIGIIVLLGVVSTIPLTRRTNPPVVSAFTAPSEVLNVVKRACYDCHSNETQWPWYSAVPPTRWLVVNHVRRGRNNLNFSEWPTVDFELQDMYFDGIWSALDDGSMPPASYQLMHTAARLTDDERAALLEWFAPMMLDPNLLTQ